MPIQIHKKSDVQEMLTLLKQKIEAKDPALMTRLASAGVDPSLGDPHTYLVSEVNNALAEVTDEQHYAGETFHSRNQLAALAQSHLSTQSNTALIQGDLADALPAVVDMFGEGNPIVWSPVMINILMEHLKAKADFKVATDANSYIRIPDKCSIALLGDWGADNDHARRIAALVRERNVDMAIHLGDIYYAGNQFECERFLKNWPLEIKGRNSFALNGNHEMYSRGIPFFNTVLPAFGQEASYFTLYNNSWQLHGLDTAYVPFSIDGSVEPDTNPSLLTRIFDRVESALPFVNHKSFDRKPDTRLQAQWDWFQAKLSNSGTRKNIFLSHNQPVSAYLPDFQVAAPLYHQFQKLCQTMPNGVHTVFAWFFGHEHRGTIYRDDATEFKARLIGNGAIPHSRQTLVPAAKDASNDPCTKVFTMNDRVLRADLLGFHELDLAVSTFALLTIDGPDAFVEYINEDGSLFLKEKLSGGPNEVLEWGEGYKQI